MARNSGNTRDIRNTKNIFETSSEHHRNLKKISGTSSKSEHLRNIFGTGLSSQPAAPRFSRVRLDASPTPSDDQSFEGSRLAGCPGRRTARRRRTGKTGSPASPSGAGRSSALSDRAGGLWASRRREAWVWWCGKLTTGGVGNRRLWWGCGQSLH